MGTTKSKRMIKKSHFLCVIFTLSVLLTPGIHALYGDDSIDSRHIVEKSAMTIENFINAPEMEGFRGLIKKARGVFIAPQVLKGAFIIGASGGSGVLVVKDVSTGKWSGPAFYTIGSASFGFQAGGQSSELVLLVMTERGISALLKNSVKLGADIGVAAGPVGMGAALSTANLSVDIISFVRSKGLYGGLSLDGAFIKVREDLNGAYYNKSDATPEGILIKKRYDNPHRERLIEAVEKAIKRPEG
ncbi:MAG: lipid-binding SYLF domain-containing protein [Syntrophorhabdaceae bacterium]|nr:lipid-binding SYLF domain-containing protein [Syntrophorhabdaceae bacterium]